MTARPTTPTPRPDPKPQPAGPWDNPTTIPTTPRYQPTDQASALGDLRGIHQVLAIHLRSHGDTCGPRCRDFVDLLAEAGAVLAHTAPVQARPVLLAVA